MNSRSVLMKESVDQILASARKNLEVCGYLAPVLIIRLTNGELNLIPLQLPQTSEEKQTYFRAIGISLRRSGKLVQEALMLSEGWFVQAEKSPESWNIIPSQHPDRKEAITAVGCNRDGTRHTSVIQPYTRSNPGKFSWESPAITLYNKPVERGSFPVGLLEYLFICFTHFIIWASEFQVQF
jgi:hypothetical protein